MGQWVTARFEIGGITVPTGDIYKVTLEGIFAGEPVVMGLGFVSNSGAPDFDTEAGELAAEVRNALDINGAPSGFMSPLSVQFKLNAVRVQDINPGVSAGQVVPVALEGGNTVDDAMAPNDALCVTWRTGLKGKQNRGRTYLTGFAEDSGNAGYWVPEIQDWARVAFVDPLMAAFGPVGSGNYALSLIHTQAGGVRIIPPTATQIIRGSVNNTVRSLRRRAVGVRISRRRTGP
jgi:hypothetical protein